MHKEIKNLQDIKKFLFNHSAFIHPFFDYLKDPEREGFTPQQFKIFGYNYLYRTLSTIPSITNVVKLAALNGDLENLALAGKNLYEETGRGQKDKSHIKLLEESFKIHGEKVFKIDVSNINDSYEIIAEAKLYRIIQNHLYQYSPYLIVIGANYAQESAAPLMLENIYNAFYMKYKGYYNEKSFKNVSNYFIEHLNGLEEEHAKNAEKIILNNIRDPKNIIFILYGIKSFLDIQSQLWDGLHKELKKVENQHEIIKFN